MAETITKMAGTNAGNREVLVKLCEGLAALAAKLDADGGVTDTDYAATLATYLTINSTLHTVKPV